jgi:hypothetical protein
MMQSQTNNKIALEDAGNKVLPVVFNILDKWNCSQANQMLLLGLTNRSTLTKYRAHPDKAKVSKDLLERMSYLLNIHKCLRILFSHDDSVYNWVNKPNKQAFFAGKTAMEVMTQGKVADLYNVATRLNAYRGGMS